MAFLSQRMGRADADDAGADYCDLHEEAAYFGMSLQLKEPGGGWANAELLGGMLWSYGLFWTGWSIPCFIPCRG
jgi:hypothetical protein